MDFGGTDALGPQHFSCCSHALYTPNGSATFSRGVVAWNIRLPPSRAGDPTDNYKFLGYFSITRTDLPEKNNQSITRWTPIGSSLLSHVMPTTESDSTWSPSAQYTKVVEANRQFYAKQARLFDNCETVLHDCEAQHHLQQTLDELLRVMDRPITDVRVLDACGGTGNVALKLLKRGLNVTLTDISREQLAIFEEKSAALPTSARVVCGEIGSFLAEHPGEFDLIVFSAALHHLENYPAVLNLCLTALRPRGLVFTINDPATRSNHKFLTRQILLVDYLMFKILDNTSDLPAALGRRAKRMISGAQYQAREEMQINDATAGVLAEYYAHRGIDDLKLAEELRKAGFEVVWHKRRAAARYRIFRKLVKWTGAITEFELLLRKPMTLQ
jgi:2-polyprenyl-3-methyl-5-hydroxy-6-metoxy-1,4-benzoquinol methylase